MQCVPWPLWWQMPEGTRCVPYRAKGTDIAVIIGKGLVGHIPFIESLTAEIIGTIIIKLKYSPYIQEAPELVL